MNGREFEIVGADARVLNYLLEKGSAADAADPSGVLPPHCALSLRAYFREKGLLKEKEQQQQ